MDKSELRSRLTAQRRAYSAALSAADRVRWDETASTSVLEAIPELAGRTIVASYQSLPSEPPTQAINAELAKRGCEVWLPEYRDAAGHELPELLWRNDHGQVRTAVEFAKIVQLILVPALAATANGDRLGKGRGYYDKFLAEVKISATTLAIVRDVELLDMLPTEPHDIRTQHVITVADVTGGQRQRR